MAGGITYIKATYMTASGFRLITVEKLPVKLMVAGSDLDLHSNKKTTQLTAMAFYSDGTKKDVTASVTWESSFPEFASVSSSGLVTAGSLAGATMIKATMTYIQGHAIFQGKSNHVYIIHWGIL